MKTDFFWRPDGHLFDYDFNMIIMMAMISISRNHDYHNNHIKIIDKQVAVRPPKKIYFI